MEGLGRRIKELRIKAGLTQKDLAEYLEMTPTNISDYEREVATPPIKSLIKLAKILNTTIDWLATGEGSSDKIDISLTEIKTTSESLPPEMMQSLGRINRILIENPQFIKPVEKMTTGMDSLKKGSDEVAELLEKSTKILDPKTTSQ